MLCCCYLLSGLGYSCSEVLALLCQCCLGWACHSFPPQAGKELGKIPSVCAETQGEVFLNAVRKAFASWLSSLCFSFMVCCQAFFQSWCWRRAFVISCWPFGEPDKLTLPDTAFRRDREAQRSGLHWDKLRLGKQILICFCTHRADLPGIPKFTQQCF